MKGKYMFCNIFNIILKTFKDYFFTISLMINGRSGIISCLD